MSAPPIEISKSLSDLLASTRREKAEPKGHTRELIAVALRGSRPSYLQHDPSDAYTLFLYESQNMRDWYERWADDFLRYCDHLKLEVIDKSKD